MARGIRIPIIGDPDSVLRAINKTIAAGDRLGASYKHVGVTAEESARLQIAASTKKEARLRSEVAVYRQIASTAARGSKEQITATNLATQAEKRLSRSLSVTAHEASSLAASTRRAERDFGRATRGALAGSGVFRGLGRSLAFASGGFLAFASAGQLVRSSIDAATQALATQRQLAAQFKASGLDLSLYRRQIEETANATSALSGFTRDDLNQAFITAFRGSKNVTVSLKEERIAADVARGRHIGLAQSALALAKAYGGQVTALRRLGIQVPKNLKGLDALNFVAARFAGQARAGATAQQRFGAELHNTEETIGQALLPSVNKYLAAGSKWLAQSDNQKRIQRDVAEGAKLVGHAVSGLAGAFKIAKAVLSPFVNALGGVENTAKLVGLAFVGIKVNAAAAVLGLNTVGSAAVVAEGEMGGAATSAGILGTRLTALTAAPWLVTIAVAVQDVRDPSSIKRRAKGLLDIIKGGGNIEKGLEGLPTVGPLIEAANRALNVPGSKQKPLPSGQSPIGENALGNRPAVDSSKALSGRLGLLARFAKADLVLAKAERTKITRDDRAALQAEAAILKDEIASRKKVFRDKAALERQLGGIENQIEAIDKAAADARKQAADARRQRAQARRAAVVQALQINIDRAGLTKGLGDDVKATAALLATLKRQLRLNKNNLDIQQQIVGVEGQLAGLEQQQRDQAAQRRQAAATRRENRQFRILGLGPGGAALTPTRNALKKELGSIEDSLKGTFLDTNATRSVLSKIRKLMKSQLGGLSADVRSTVKQMLDDLKGQLNGFDGFNLTQAEKRRRFLDKTLSGPVGSGSSSGSTKRAAGTVVHVHQTIVAQKGESADALARRQHFRARQAFAH